MDKQELRVEQSSDKQLLVK